MVTENINIDVRPGGIPIVIHVTQYEVGLRQFVFTPYTSNGTQTIVAGSATLEGTKPDGYAFQQACEMADGVITYTLQEQLCAVEGRVWSRLVIRDTNGGMIGYTAIVWVVGRAGVADDAVMSDSDISALRQFLDEFGDIDAYRGALNGALAAVGGPLVAATASAMTDTTKVYVYTGSESGYTEGHWYYWSGSAWTDGGVYQATGINTDKTLTVEDMAADAKATGDAVAELKNAITVLKLPLTQGHYINKKNGQFPASDNFSISDFCPFSAGDKFELFDFNNASWASYCLGYAFYDINKAYIANSGSGNFDGHLSSSSVTIPQNTAYVRFSTRTQFSPNAYVVISYINGSLANLKSTIDEEINGAINTIGIEINRLSNRTESAFDDISSNNGFVNEFKGFDTSVVGVGSTTFRAFATRYSFTGEVDKVSVYARCSGDSATLNVEIAIWDGTFTSVLASKTVTVQSSNAMQWIDVVFNSPIQLSGNFYVSIKAATGNVASTPDETTQNCTAIDSGTTNTNKYIPSSESTDIWYYCGNKYCLDVILYRNGRELKHHIPTIIYVGNQNGCDYTTIQDAIDSITDDSPSKPYTIIILPGNYARFKLRGINYQTPRWISLLGYDSNTTIVYDNLGDYSYPPAEIQTNGTIQGISFINMTDAEHHTQTQGRTFAYAVHIDFGSCKVKFINCKFVSNAGAAVGIGTSKDCDFTFENCTFISECDGTFGDVGHGGLFVHTGLADNQTNQCLTVRNSISYAPHQQYGARFAVISGYAGGTYNYNFQNFGAFGNNGAAVSLQDPDNNLLGEYNFNNLPLLLNTV